MIITIAQALNISLADLFIRDVSKTKKDIKKEVIDIINNYFFFY